MDITPHTNLLRSLRGERINLNHLIGEGVDNALDAGARFVKVVIDKDHIKFADDGLGITKKRIPALFTLGQHAKQSTTQLGRFGIGITNQAVNAGDEFRVVSKSTDGEFYAVANWRDVLDSDRWYIDEPTWRPVAVDKPTGTTIEISKLRKRPQVSMEKVKKDLANVFHPALADGRWISLNGERISALPEPAMTDIVDRQLPLSGGRGVHVRGGILAGPSHLEMVHVAYGHRVIMARSRVGCGEYSGVTKMFARVTLTGRNWHLAKFKDDLTDEDEREELERVVGDALRPILEKCNAVSMTVKIKELAARVNERLPPELRPSRPNRAKAGSEASSGKRKRGGGDVDKDKSKESSSGPVKSKRQPKNELVIYFEGKDEEQGVGIFISGRPNCVNLSPDNALVKQLMEARDQDLAIEMLHALALAIFIDAQPQRSMFPFGDQLARLLSLQSGTVSISKKA